MDEDALHTSALWGLVRRSYQWREVERIDHDTELEFPGQFTLPKAWYLVMKNRRNLFGLQPRYVGATRDLINFPLSLTILERKSVEFSFPIVPIR